MLNVKLCASEILFYSHDLTFQIIIQDAREQAIPQESQKPEQATLSVAEPEKPKYQRGEKENVAVEDDAKKLKIGKGVVPDKKEEAENVKLKSIPEKQVKRK